VSNEEPATGIAGLHMPSIHIFCGVWIGDLPEAEQLKSFNRLKRDI
jgi:hypothetical protein